MTVHVKAPEMLHPCPPGEAVTENPVTGCPPLDAGAVQLTITLEFPGVAVAPVGGAGVVAGITGALGLEARPLPTPFVAVTVKV